MSIYSLGVLCMPDPVPGGNDTEFLKLIWESLDSQQSEWNLSTLSLSFLFCQAVLARMAISQYLPWGISQAVPVKFLAWDLA